MDSNDSINNQYLLIKSYRFWIKGSETAKANKLLEVAKLKGYCDTSQEISGNKLKTWVKSERAPIWAYKAAVELLLDTEYLPRTNSETKAFAFIFSGLNKEISALPTQLLQNQSLCEAIKIAMR